MAFNKIYNLYYLKIYQFVYRVSFSTQDSEDITQDVFMTLHNELRRNKTPKNIKAWLYKCALNKYINTSKRKKSVQLTENINQFENAFLISLEKEIIQNEKKKTIATAVTKLSPKEQMLINLYNDEFSYKEISEILEIKYTSVGKTLSRVIEKLTKQIKLTSHEELFEQRRIV